ncbi:MAG: ArsA family ATPase [Salinigranum sp.]
MAQIDVEPVERVEDEVEIEWTGGEEWEPAVVDAPEYVLYGGKGGVGKTTMAAATALASAAAGTSTLVVSTDPAHSLSDTLGVDVPPDPARIREDVPLFAAEIDPDAVLEGPFGETGTFGGFDADADVDTDEFGDPFDDGPGESAGAGGATFGGGSPDGDDAFGGGEDPFGGSGGGGGGNPLGGGPLGGLGELLGGDGASPLGGPMPGADEAAAMQQLLAYLDDDRFDRVVVDTAPTGHTLRLLELPEIMDSMIGRIVKLRERFRGMMDSVKGLFGAGGDAEAGFAELEDLAERIERLRAVLRDPDRTDFRVVMIPEEMSVVESERLIQRLDEFGIPVRTLVINRVMEDLADVVDDDALAAATGGAPDATGGTSDASGDASDDPDSDGHGADGHGSEGTNEWVVSPDLESCAFCQRRWQVQQRALQRATDLFRGREIKRVPLLADEVSGAAALRVVAACLE